MTSAPMTTARITPALHTSSSDELGVLRAALTHEHLRELLAPECYEALITPCELWRSVEVGLPLLHATSCEAFSDDPVRRSTLVDYFSEWAEFGLRVHDCLPAGLEIWKLWCGGRLGSANIDSFRTEATRLFHARAALLHTRPLPSLLELLEVIERPGRNAPPTLRELHVSVTGMLTQALAPLSAEEVAALLPSLTGYEPAAVIPRGSGRALHGPRSVLVAGELPGTLLRLWGEGTRHRDDVFLVVCAADEAELLAGEMERVNLSLAPHTPLPALAGSWDWARAAPAQILILDSYIETVGDAAWDAEASQRALQEAVQLASEVFTT